MLWKASIAEEPNLEIIYETPLPVLFSFMYEGAFEKRWKPWKLRHFEMRRDGTLVCRKIRKSAIKAKLDLNSSVFSRIALDGQSYSNNDQYSDQKEYGMSATCLLDNVETSFRCVMKDGELNRLFDAIRQYCPRATINSEITNLERTNSVNEAEHSNKRLFASRSVMRTAITHAMDKHAHFTTHQQIRQKRGVFKWLPIMHSNDLVHGSWWFVVGSVFIVVTAAVTLYNSFHKILGEDDSTLTTFHYRGSWVLMIISGFFFTLGSLAFVRAVHESPPMKPLFSWYHIGTDELLGSWLFLIAVLPFVPYSLIYLSEARNNFIYMGLLAAAVILIVGCFLFVLSCYPTPEGQQQRQYFYPILKYLLCCCCSKQWIYRNLSNDWLAGTWIILWGTLLACVATFIMTLSAAASLQGLQVFIYSTTFLENLIFLVGSAYFVAGSYPDSLTDSLLDTAIDGDFSGLNPAAIIAKNKQHGSGGEDVYYLADDGDDV